MFTGRNVASMEDFTHWLEIGRGDERVCYQNPDDASRCIKVSSKKKCKQSMREIRYFRYLVRREVPFVHLPRFYGAFETDSLIGIEQELIRDQSGKQPLDVRHYLKNPLSPKQQEDFWVAMADLKSYLVRYNVIPCDLVMSNMLVLEEPGSVRIMLIDGLGGAEVIPFSDYIRCLGRKKIQRKWERYINKVVRPHFDMFQSRLS